jgi:hypothetical protein
MRRIRRAPLAKIFAKLLKRYAPLTVKYSIGGILLGYTSAIGTALYGAPSSCSEKEGNKQISVSELKRKDWTIHEILI